MIESIESLTEEIELHTPREQDNLVLKIARESKILTQEKASNGTLIRTLMTSRQLDCLGKFKS